MIGGPGSQFPNQTRWMDDSTSAQMANGVSEANNMEDENLGFNLASVYIETHVARNLDWLDNKST